MTSIDPAFDKVTQHTMLGPYCQRYLTVALSNYRTTGTSSHAYHLPRLVHCVEAASQLVASHDPHPSSILATTANRGVGRVSRSPWSSGKLDGLSRRTRCHAARIDIGRSVEPPRPRTSAGLSIIVAACNATSDYCSLHSILRPHYHVVSLTLARFLKSSPSPVLECCCPIQPTPAEQQHCSLVRLHQI